MQLHGITHLPSTCEVLVQFPSTLPHTHLHPGQSARNHCCFPKMLGETGGKWKQKHFSFQVLESQERAPLSSR